jgi:hypothetical protein
VLGDSGKLHSLSGPLFLICKMGNDTNTDPHSSCEDYICKAFEACLAQVGSPCTLVVLIITVLFKFLNL